jgi:hypothetical protein
MSQHALTLRFLTRTQAEVAQMSACLPEAPFPLEPAAISHIQRTAQKISSAAEAFGFPEIDTIAAGIELLTQDGLRTVRQRRELAVVLEEKSRPCRFTWNLNSPRKKHGAFLQNCLCPHQRKFRCLRICRDSARAGSDGEVMVPGPRGPAPLFHSYASRIGLKPP